MECLHKILSKYIGNYLNMVVWETCCTAYFIFFHISEFTSSAKDCSTANTLQLTDVALGNHTGPK